MLLWDVGTPSGNQIDFGISVNGAAYLTQWRAACHAGTITAGGVAMPLSIREKATGVGAGQTIAIAANNDTAVTVANWIDISRIAVQPIRIA